MTPHPSLRCQLCSFQSMCAQRLRTTYQRCFGQRRGIFVCPSSYATIRSVFSMAGRGEGKRFDRETGIGQQVGWIASQRNR